MVSQKRLNLATQLQTSTGRSSIRQSPSMRMGSWQEKVFFGSVSNFAASAFMTDCQWEFSPCQEALQLERHLLVAVVEREEDLPS